MVIHLANQQSLLRPMLDGGIIRGMPLTFAKDQHYCAYILSTMIRAARLANTKNSIPNYPCCESDWRFAKDPFANRRWPRFHAVSVHGLQEIMICVNTRIAARIWSCFLQIASDRHSTFRLHSSPVPSADRTRLNLHLIIL